MLFDEQGPELRALLTTLGRGTRGVQGISAATKGVGVCWSWFGSMGSPLAPVTGACVVQSAGVGPSAVGALHHAPTQRHVALPVAHARMSLAFEVPGASCNRERRKRGHGELPAAERPGSMTQSQDRLARRRTMHGSRRLDLTNTRARLARGGAP